MRGQDCEFTGLLSRTAHGLKFFDLIPTSEAFNVELEENVELTTRDLEAVVSVPNKDRMFKFLETFQK